MTYLFSLNVLSLTMTSITLLSSAVGLVYKYCFIFFTNSEFIFIVDVDVDGVDDDGCGWRCC